MLKKIFRSKKVRKGPFALDETFYLEDKSSPSYADDLHDMDMIERNIHNILSELANSKNPVLYLHTSNESCDEIQECIVTKFEKGFLYFRIEFNHEKYDQFFKQCSPVRFSFRYKHHVLIFEADILGKIQEEDENIYLTQCIDKIYKERRSHQRYTLWPNYDVVYDDMQVSDISQVGISFYSEFRFKKEDTIDNAYIEFPSIYCDDGSECFFEAEKMKIPQTVISDFSKTKKGYRYGGYFVGKWPDGSIKTLNDFLLAVRKKNRESKSPSDECV